MIIDRIKNTRELYEIVDCFISECTFQGVKVSWITIQFNHDGFIVRGAKFNNNIFESANISFRVGSCIFRLEAWYTSDMSRFVDLESIVVDIKEEMIKRYEQVYNA